MSDKVVHHKPSLELTLLYIVKVDADDVNQTIILGRKRSAVVGTFLSLLPFMKFDWKEFVEFAWQKGMSGYKLYYFDPETDYKVGKPVEDKFEAMTALNKLYCALSSDHKASSIQLFFVKDSSMLEYIPKGEIHNYCGID